MSKLIDGNNKKIISFLQELGLNDEYIENFLILIQPAVAEILLKRIMSAFSEEEILAFEQTALARNFNDEDKFAMYQLGYEELTGANMSDEVDEVLDHITEILSRAKDDTVKIIQNLNENSTDEEVDAKIGEVVEEYINNYM